MKPVRDSILRQANKETFHEHVHEHIVTGLWGWFTGAEGMIAIRENEYSGSLEHKVSSVCESHLNPNFESSYLSHLFMVCGNGKVSILCSCNLSLISKAYELRTWEERNTIQKACVLSPMPRLFVYASAVLAVH